MSGRVTNASEYFSTATLSLTLLFDGFFPLVFLFSLQIMQSKEEHGHSVPYDERNRSRTTWINNEYEYKIENNIYDADKAYKIVIFQL